MHAMCANSHLPLYVQSLLIRIKRHSSISSITFCIQFADLEDPLEAPRKVMLVHGTAWQPDICLKCLQVLALGIASTRLRDW